MSSEDQAMAKNYHLRMISYSFVVTICLIVFTLMFQKYEANIFENNKNHVFTKLDKSEETIKITIAGFKIENSSKEISKLYPKYNVLINSIDISKSPDYIYIESKDYEKYKNAYKIIVVYGNSGIENYTKIYMVNKEVKKNKYHDLLFQEVLLNNKYHTTVNDFMKLYKENSAGNFFIKNKAEYKGTELVEKDFFKSDSILLNKEKQTMNKGYVAALVFLVFIFCFFSILIINDFAMQVENRHLGLIIIIVIGVITSAVSPY